MNGQERVRRTLQGLPVDRQPIYGWLFANLTDPITEAFGSVEAFEDHYEFDIAHIFGGPRCFNWEILDRIRDENGGELTPDLLVDVDFLLSPDEMEGYESMAASLAHHKARGRFTYVQTRNERMAAALIASYPDAKLKSIIVGGDIKQGKG